ncbi:efflux transporter outer membrane subunit [Marinilabiliaceae bacterium JC017]|nr:efflux transporter outer membrane subunit [Marinilabiliaceae bacterium JC017]
MIKSRLLIQSTALIALLLFSTVSCKIGKNYTQPEIDAPELFRFAEEDSTANSALKWWDIFDDPVLDSLIYYALDHNRELQIAVHNIEQARYGLSIQKAEMLPKINAQGQAQRGNFIQGPSENVDNMFVLAGQATWELDFWGKYRRLNEASRAQYLASEYGLQSLQISVISTVATTYFNLLEHRERLEIAKSTLNLRDSSLNLIQQRFNAGIIPEIDLNHAQIQRAIAAKSIPQFERFAAQAENALSVLIGKNPQNIINNNELENISIIPEIPAGLPSELLERRPDILIAEQELVMQNAMVGVAQANRLPSFSLTGMFGAVSNDLSSLTSNDPAWNIGGSILGPLFHWNQNANRVKIEKSKREAIILNYENVALNAFREVEDALVEIETLKDEQLATQDHVNAALSAEKLSADRYDKGIASYIEYLESQRQAFEAQISLVGVRQQLLSAYIKLYKVLGGGWATQSEMASQE